MQQPHNSLLLWLIQQTQPWHHSKTPTLLVELTYMCAAHNLWPREYLMTCTCSAINDLCCYILIVYKTWAQRAWTHHPGQFALCPQEVSKRDEQWRKGLTLKLFTRKKRQTVLEFKRKFWFSDIYCFWCSSCFHVWKWNHLYHSMSILGSFKNNLHGNICSLCFKAFISVILVVFRSKPLFILHNLLWCLFVPCIMFSCN